MSRVFATKALMKEARKMGRCGLNCRKSWGKTSEVMKAWKRGLSERDRMIEREGI